MIQKNLFLLICICITRSFAWGQEKAEKWGEIPSEDLQMTVYPQDSAAAAVILQDVGSIQMNTVGGQYQLWFKQHRRVKVFDVKAFAEGNLRIPYYSYNGMEKILDLDVQLILPNGDKQKVKSDNVFTEKISRYWSAKKVFIPNLQKGSIIEYRFELRSEFITRLHDWYFQGELPVRWSELSLSVPTYFNYVYLTRLPRPLDVKESQLIGDTWHNRYGMRQLPAIRDEPFITTLDDYRAHIGFQLASVSFPNQPERKFMTTWTDLAKSLETQENFGQQYMRDKKFDDLWEVISPRLNPGTEPTDSIVQKVMRFVSMNIKWNEVDDITLDGSLNDAFARKTGSTAEVNLAVVALLRKVGLDAVPMLVSTRDNGVTYPAYPFREQFNSVLAFLRKPEGNIVLDATSPYFSPGQLRTRHYNGNGWLVDSKQPDWVDVPAPEMSQAWYGQLALSESGEMAGKFTISVTGAIAADWRAALEHLETKSFLKKHFATGYPEIVLDSIVLTDLYNYSKPLKIGFSCRIPNTSTVVNDFIYCRPVLDFLVDENPFKSLRRTFPVNFAYPFKGTYVLHLQLPPGYVVEELPEPARISLADDGGKISFICSSSKPEMVQVQFKMNLANTRFEPEDYAALRRFFDLAAEKTQLQLVLKKG